MNNVVDRVPTQVLSNGAVRWEQFDAQGNSLGYVYLKRADEPSTEGTKLNKVLFDSIQTDLNSRLLASLKATQAQAEAGTDNTRYMTALRVLQEINSKALPSKQMSIKSGTIEDGETIAQTSGYTHYLYFVSVNSISEIQTHSNHQNYQDYISIECSVDQTTREVVCQAKYKSTYNDRWYTVSGTANYIEIAYN